MLICQGYVRLQECIVYEVGRFCSQPIWIPCIHSSLESFCSRVPGFPKPAKVSACLRIRVYVTLGIQVCPKKGISPTILF